MGTATAKALRWEEHAGCLRIGKEARAASEVDEEEVRPEVMGEGAGPEGEGL